MQKVFWDDPYQTQLKAKVVEVDANQILLDRTIIFSFSGGQESDKATIAGMDVLHSTIQGYLIYYEVTGEHQLKVGDEVLLEIDWPRRYRLMRLHFAAELILELVSKKLNVEKIGAHIAEHKARIDFYYDQNISQYFDEWLQEFNMIIGKDLPIVKDFLDVAQQKRFWEIEGFAKVPCGGTHVKSTKEVGAVKLKRKNIGGGKERIEIMLVE